MAEKFDSLEEHLEKFIENIRQLGIIVSDFQPSSQAVLNQKLWVFFNSGCSNNISQLNSIRIDHLPCFLCSNFMISGLQDVEKCRQQLHEINVPLEVFEWVQPLQLYQLSRFISSFGLCIHATWSFLGFVRAQENLWAKVFSKRFQKSNDFTAIAWDAALMCLMPYWFIL